MLTPKTVADWLAYGGLVLPLFGLVWAALFYVKTERTKARQTKFENFFTTVMRVHNADKALLSQKAAIFELRNYPEYRALVLRICEDPTPYFGSNLSEELQVEFDETAAFLRKNS